MRRRIVLAGAVAITAMVLTPLSASAAVIQIGGTNGTIISPGIGATYVYTPPRNGVASFFAEADTCLTMGVSEKNGAGKWRLVAWIRAADGASNSTFSGDVIVRKAVGVRVRVDACDTRPELAWSLHRNPCTIVGTLGNDLLQGTSGDDELCGLSGDDTFVATGGDDTYWGGSGSDTLSFEDSPVGIDAQGHAHSSNSGQPTGDASAGAWGTAHYVNVENIRGSIYDDRIADSESQPQECSSCDIGIDSANVFIGGPGNDSLDGGGGPDALYGWAGDDTLAAGTSDHCAYPPGRGNLCDDYPFKYSLADGGQGNDQLDLSAWDSCPPNQQHCHGQERLVVVGVEDQTFRDSIRGM